MNTVTCASPPAGSSSSNFGAFAFGAFLLQTSYFSSTIATFNKFDILLKLHVSNLLVVLLLISTVFPRFNYLDNLA